MLATQYRQFVAQYQNLDLLGLSRPMAQRDQIEDAAQRQVDERPHHQHLATEEGQATTHRSSMPS